MKQLDFIQYVARELSISYQESQELLREFSIHLNNELNETASVQLTGLGTLKKDIFRISLELEPSFAIEINYKYAGMQPIVVSDDFNVGIEEDEENEVEDEPEVQVEPEVDNDDEVKARIAKRTASLRSPKKTKKSNLTPIYIGIGVVFIAAMIAGWQFYLKPILDEPAMLVGDSGTEQSNVTEAMDSNSISEEQQLSAALHN